MAATFDVTSFQEFNTSSAGTYLNGAVGGTLMAWVSPNTLGSLLAQVIFLPTSGGNPRLNLYASLTGVLTASVRNADADVTSTLVSTGTIATGSWSHVCLSYDCVSKNGSFYLNGVLAGTANAATATGNSFSATNPGTTFIGSDSTANYFDGNMCDARIYKRALGKNEILTIYSTRGKDGIVFGLQSRWLMNEKASGQILKSLDISSTPNSIIGGSNAGLGGSGTPGYAMGIVEAPFPRLSGSALR